MCKPRQTRNDARPTQTEVAAKFGAHASFVSKCESGEGRIDVVETAEFCRIYGSDVAQPLRNAGVE
jgi:hypothetical protein